MDDSNVYAVIMAGGRGERFWPQSRTENPKQLLRLMGNLTMIEQATDRLISVVPVENIIVVTNKEYVSSMQQLLRRIPSSNILGEIQGKDTAACMALAAGIIRERGGDDAVMIVSPADHTIRSVPRFRTVIRDAVQYAKNHDKLITLGIKPKFDSTGFGYIKPTGEAEDLMATTIHSVGTFIEKPESAIADAAVKSGEWWWNSGFFIWRVSTIMQTMQVIAPELHGLALATTEAEKEGNLWPIFTREYDKVPQISIDYAIMEKVSNVAMIEADFDWEDVGSWSSVRNQTRAGANNNVVRGLYAPLDSSNCCVISRPGHLIATIDVHDLIIVQTEDATLICSEKSAQRVKELVQKLNKNPELKKFL